MWPPVRFPDCSYSWLIWNSSYLCWGVALLSSRVLWHTHTPTALPTRRLFWTRLVFVKMSHSYPVGENKYKLLRADIFQFNSICFSFLIICTGKKLTKCSREPWNGVTLGGENHVSRNYIKYIAVMLHADQQSKVIKMILSSFIIAPVIVSTVINFIYIDKMSRCQYFQQNTFSGAKSRHKYAASTKRYNRQR